MIEDLLWLYKLFSNVNQQVVTIPEGDHDPLNIPEDGLEDENDDMEDENTLS